MPNRKIVYSFLLLLFALSSILFLIILFSRKKSLEVAFLDVGQGDAILISRGSRQILIDGGPSGQKILEKLGENVPFWDRDIEIILATHPDADHITGLVDVMEKYNVGAVVDSGAASDSQIYSKLKETIRNKNIQEIEGIKNMKIKIGDGAEMDIIAPDGTQLKDNPKDTNAASIVSRLSFGENSFLFTGDISYDNEKALAESSEDIHSDYLKVSHHGSKYATSQIFLDKIKPRAAVISSGKDNRYGHPSPDVLARLEENKIEIYRTDQEGDIIYKCDERASCNLYKN